MISIFDIKPNIVSRDLGSRSFFFYGGPKIGKTTLASKFDKSLILAFEKGYGELPGAMAVPINSWADFISVLSELKKDKRMEATARKKNEKYNCMYKTIVIDVADIAFDYCEKYILSKNGVDKVSEIPYGNGYKEIEREFDTRLRSIVQMGYGLVLISHEKLSTSSDNETTYATCTLSNTARKICTRLVDVYAYICEERDDNGHSHRVIHTRATSNWDAGGRLIYLKDTFPLSYKNLEKEIQDAISKLENETDPDYFTDEEINLNKVDEGPNFVDLMDEINSTINRLMSDEGNRAANAEKISGIIARELGENKKLSQATPSNIEQLIIINKELKDLN